MMRVNTPYQVVNCQHIQRYEIISMNDYFKQLASNHNHCHKMFYDNFYKSIGTRICV